MELELDCSCLDLLAAVVLWYMAQLVTRIKVGLLVTLTIVIESAFKLQVVAISGTVNS